MDRPFVSGVLLMLLANDTITIVHHTETAAEDVYTCTVCVGVSWFGKRGMTASASGGLSPSIEYTVRIPEEVVPETLPKPGDIIVHGVLASYSGKSSLKGREYFTAFQVGDNRRAKLLPHLVVRSA